MVQFYVTAVIVVVAVVLTRSVWKCQQVDIIKVAYLQVFNSFSCETYWQSHYSCC